MKSTTTTHKPKEDLAILVLLTVSVPIIFCVTFSTSESPTTIQLLIEKFSLSAQMMMHPFNNFYFGEIAKNLNASSMAVLLTGMLQVSFYPFFLLMHYVWFLMILMQCLSLVNLFVPAKNESRD